MNEKIRQNKNNGEVASVDTLDNPDISFDDRFNADKYGTELAREVKMLFWDLTSHNDQDYESPVVETDEIFDGQLYHQLDPKIQADFLTDIIEECQRRLIRFEKRSKTNSEDQQSTDYNQDVYTDEILHSGENEISLESYELTIKKAILNLKENDSEENIEFLLNFWTKNKDPYYGPAIAETGSKINPSFTYGKILEQISESDQEDQARLLSLLYRLELGVIGLDEQGLNYLNQKFEIEGYNDPAKFAQRLTADGKVGIFSQNQELEGFFQLEANDFLSEHAEPIKKQLQSITKELLFYPKADETPEEQSKREAILKQFCANYFETYLQLFPENSHVRFNDLNLREQGWALLYLDGADKEKQEEFFSFAADFGEDGIRSLIAMDYGSELGSDIMAISKELKLIEAKAFFKNFSSIIASAEVFGEKWGEGFTESGLVNSEFLSIQITEAIIRKSTDFITAARQVPSETVQMTEIIGSLQEFDFVLVQLTDAFKTSGSSFEISGRSFDEPSFASTWHLQNKNLNYKVNLTVRDQEGVTSVKDKNTGARRQIATEPGIRATFIWPDNKKFGLRLDLDSHYADETFAQGKLSLDIGSRESIIANILDRVSPEGGHHNTQSFSPELSDPQVFSSICQNLNQILEERQTNS